MFVKFFSTVLAFSALASVAQARTMLPSVLNVTTSGGFMHLPKYTQLTVYADGQVVVREVLRGKVTNTHAVFTFSEVAFSRLMERVQMIDLNKELELVDRNAPACQDAPTTRFEVMTNGGRKGIVFAEERDCRIYSFEDGYAYEVRELLENMYALSRLAR